jgi:hypothetical protein
MKDGRKVRTFPSLSQYNVLMFFYSRLDGAHTINEGSPRYRNARFEGREREGASIRMSGEYLLFRLGLPCSRLHIPANTIILTGLEYWTIYHSMDERLLPFSKRRIC